MYTVNEVAEILKVQPMMIYNALYDGRIKGIKIGRVWRIQEEEVQRIMREGF